MTCRTSVTSEQQTSVNKHFLLFTRNCTVLLLERVQLSRLFANSNDLLVLLCLKETKNHVWYVFTVNQALLL